MHRTRIKFCGITRPVDAIAAASAGADAIGLIFYEKSSRAISVEQARVVLQSLPPMVTPVALFVNESPHAVINIVRTLNIRTVQLHGDEPPQQLTDFAGLTVIKAIRCDAASLQVWTAAAAQHPNLAGLLLDTPGTDQRGGSGIENDWTSIKAELAARAMSVPIIAAGGLTPENIASVIGQLKPWAVDVSSGIEDCPGIKSVDKMIRFAEQVQFADRANS